MPSPAPHHTALRQNLAPSSRRCHSPDWWRQWSFQRLQGRLSAPDVPDQYSQLRRLNAAPRLEIRCAFQSSYCASGRGFRRDRAARGVRLHHWGPAHHSESRHPICPVPQASFSPGPYGSPPLGAMRRPAPNARGQADALRRRRM